MINNEIYIFIGRLCQGGGERVCVNLANSFSKNNISVNIVVLSMDDDFYSSQLDHSINLININSYNPFIILKKIRTILKKSSPQSKILSFNYHISFYLSILKRLYSFEYITRSLNTLSLEFEKRRSVKDKLIKKLVIFGLSSSSKIIAQSNGMKEDLLKFNIPLEKIITINNPINDTYINIEKNNEPNEKYIIYVGRLAEQKGLEYLLKAFVHVNKDYNLLIIGQGNKLQELIKLAKELNINKRVEFIGQQSDIAQFYRKSSLTVLSSIYEGFPNVLIESIACGTPVVSFDCPSGPNEIIYDGINGYLANYLDSHDLAVKINKALLTEFNPNALRDSVLKFHPENITNEYVKTIFQ